MESPPGICFVNENGKSRVIYRRGQSNFSIIESVAVATVQADEAIVLDIFIAPCESLKT